MDTGEKYSPNMIRLWRVFRTTKEMCLDRVQFDLKVSTPLG